MPTLRRSKSLNDKISRQKNRSAAGDFVRDPRSPEVEGRTRTNVDNFQALVHLRKQTEDKARQLELAFSYATNGHNTYLRPATGGGAGGIPLGGVELPYPLSTKSPKHPGGGDLFSDSKPPVPVVRRQHSAEGRSSVVKRQESFSGSPGTVSSLSQHQSRSREQRRGGIQRPMSMVEPLAGGGLFLPTQEELSRKDQVIQNLTEGQRSLNAHNQKLLSKVDELEFENNRLKELLNAATAAAASSANQQGSIPYTLSSSSSSTSGNGVTAPGSSIYSQGHHPHPHHHQPFPGARPPNRSISFHGGDALRVSSPLATIAPNTISNNHYQHHYGLGSPHSETSVSGYGSLADSPSGDGFATGTDSRGGGGVGMGTPPTTTKSVSGDGAGEEEDDDTMPLSGVSECSLEYRIDTLEKTTSSSSAQSSTSSSRASRVATLNSDRSDSVGDKSSGWSQIKAKKNGRRTRSSSAAVGQHQELEEEEEYNGRIEELAKQVAELSSQRDTVILRYKQLLDESLKILKRDRRVQEELYGLMQTHGDSLKGDLRSQLHSLQQQIKDPAEDVEVEVQLVLCALDLSGSNGSEPAPSITDPHIHHMLDRLLDLIGADYQRLGRRLTVPQSELDALENTTISQQNASDSTTNTGSFSQTLKTQAVLRTWLKRRGGAGGGGVDRGEEVAPPAARHLAQALRDVDKDLRHCQQIPVSGPERQALRNCLHLAVDHVADPRDVLDHLIALNELSPAGIAFVQEVLEKRERAVCRLWHVSEYRGTGMVSRLALALDRSHCNQLAHRLRDELEIQNSRLHTQSYPATDAPPPPATPTPSVVVSNPSAAPSMESGPSTSQARSRPASRVPRFRSKTFDSVSPPVKSPPAPESRVPIVRKDGPVSARPLSMMVMKGESGPPPLKDRPMSALLKDRAVLSMAGEDKSSASKNGSSCPTSQEKRRALPVPRERSFSPFHKDKSSSSQSREKPATPMQKERPLSPLVKDSDKAESVVKTEKLVLYSQRPFSPLEKDKMSRPFSPLEKDKAARPFSPFEKDKPPRPFSPENKARGSGSPFDRHKSTATPAQQGRSSGFGMQRERPFSPLQKDRAVTYKEMAVTNAQRERMSSMLLKSEKPNPSPIEDRSSPQPPKQTQAIWDKRSSAHFSSSSTASGTRDTVILEQGGKISRV